MQHEKRGRAPAQRRQHALRLYCPQDELFCMIDADGSSTISSQEFYDALADAPEPEMTFRRFKLAMVELAGVS